MAKHAEAGRTGRATAPPWELAFVEALEQDAPPQVLSLLCQAAQLSVRQSLLDEAATVSAGLQPFEPYYSMVSMAQATVAVALGKPSEALAMLDRLIAEDPQLHPAICACAMLRRELGLSGWRDLAQRVLSARGADAQSKAAAGALLELPGPAAPDGAPLRGATAHQAGLRFA